MESMSESLQEDWGLWILRGFCGFQFLRISWTWLSQTLSNVRDSMAPCQVSLLPWERQPALERHVNLYLIVLSSVIVECNRLTTEGRLEPYGTAAWGARLSPRNAEKKQCEKRWQQRQHQLQLPGIPFGFKAAWVEVLNLVRWLWNIGGGTQS